VEESVGVFGPGFGAGQARVWFCVPAPLDFSRFRIERLEEAANVGDVAGDSDDHVIANDERSHGRKVAELRVGKLDDPTNGAILGVETDDVRVGGGEIEPVLVHAQAAIADVVAFGFAMVVPNLTAIAGVDGPHVVGDGEVEDPVHFKRS
jgi:hypothetical protein